MTRTFSGAVALALVAFVSSASAQTDDVKFTASGGFNFSTGKYGEATNTRIAVALASVGLETDAFHVSAALPYLRVNGPAFVVIGGGGTPIVIDPGIGAARATRKGFGDVSLSASYSLPSESLGDFDVDIGARVKLPTADKANGLSTGETDFGFSVNISRDLGSWGPFLDLGYRIPGSPAAYTLKNSVSVSAGTSLILSDKIIAIASYDYDSASSAVAEDSHELFGSLSWLITDALVLTGYGTAGLSEGAAGAGGGLLLSLKLP